MTKSNSRLKSKRKIIQKTRNEKPNPIDFEEYICDDFSDLVKKRTRIPSRHQYFRIKNQNFIEQYYSKESSQKTRSSVTNVHLLSEKGSISNLNIPSLKSTPSYKNELNESPSIFNFLIQPNWSEFEDMEDIQFFSEQDFDYSNLLENLEKNDIMDELKDFDEFDFANDLSKSSASSLAAELSDDGLEQTVNSLDHIKTIIRDNCLTLFDKDYDITLWIEILTEVDHIIMICESNKNFLNELITKEYSSCLQEKSVQWSNLISNTLSTKFLLEIIKDSETVKRNFLIAMDIIYDQCVTISDNKILCTKDFLLKTIEGVKKISSSLMSQYKRVESHLCELFQENKSFGVPSLDQLNKEIKMLESLIYNTGCSFYHFEWMKNILGKYLGRESGFTLWHEQSRHIGLGKSHSYACQVKEEKNVYHCFIKMPFKIIFIIFMSFMCLFGNLEFDRVDLVAPDKFIVPSTTFLPAIHFSNGSCK